MPDDKKGDKAPKLKVEEVEVEEVKEQEDKPQEKTEIPSDKKPAETAPDAGVTSFKFADLDQGKADSSENVKSDEMLLPKKEEPEQEPFKEEPKILNSDSKEWLENVKVTDTIEEKKSGRGKKMFLLLLVLSLIAGLVFGGIYYYQMSSEPKDVSSPAGGVQVVETEPTPTTEEEIEEEVDYSELTLQILNGSGVSGEAGRVSALLESLNFSDISTGNADNYDYEDTEISMKQSLPESVFDEIKTLLEDNYNVVKADSTLSSGSSYDIQIIVGAKK